MTKPGLPSLWYWFGLCSAVADEVVQYIFVSLCPCVLSVLPTLLRFEALKLCRFSRWGRFLLWLRH